MFPGCSVPLMCRLTTDCFFVRSVQEHLGQAAGLTLTQSTRAFVVLGFFAVDFFFGIRDTQPSSFEVWQARLALVRLNYTQALTLRHGTRPDSQKSDCLADES